jgi:hypothetical protein
MVPIRNEIELKENTKEGHKDRQDTLGAVLSLLRLLLASIQAKERCRCTITLVTTGVKVFVRASRVASTLHHLLLLLTITPLTCPTRVPRDSITASKNPLRRITDLICILFTNNKNSKKIN